MSQDHAHTPVEQEIRPEDLATYAFLVPHDELRRRVTALQARLVAADIDLAIVQANADVGYVAGSILDGWVLVPASGEPKVLARRAAARVQAETCWPVERMVAVKQLVTELHAMGVDRGRIAMALDVVPAADYLKLAGRLPNAELVDLTHHIRSVRAVKSEWELANHRVAAEQVKEAMFTVAYQVVPGHTELDAARLSEGCLRGAGHQGVMRMRRFGGEMFFGQVCAAANAALPAALDAPLGGAGLYSKLAWDYEQRAPYHADVAAWIMQEAQIAEGALIADVGSGTGRVARAFAALGCIVDAIEPCFEMAAVGKTLDKQQRIRWHTTQAENT
ncbi:MAG: aminopeptidase P family N-terminal domain-containing protein, partial [Gaiellales bacterium]